MAVSIHKLLGVELQGGFSRGAHRHWALPREERQQLSQLYPAVVLLGHYL